MIAFNTLFWLMVILFTFIGSMRGWAKEMMVTFSVILGLFLINILTTYLPWFRPDAGMSQAMRFWVQTIIILALTFFGYQTPNVRMIAGQNPHRFNRDKLQDTMLGGLVGALNGYLIFGSIWYFMHVAGYPTEYFIPPNASTEWGQQALALIQKMPPVYLTPPWIYFAIGMAFLFVVVVFL